MSFSLLAALGAMFSWGIGDFLIQRVTRKLGDVEALAWIGIIGTLGLLPFVWNDFPTAFAGNNPWILAGLGLLTFVIALLNFEALKRGKLSIVEVILEIELPMTIILGMTFFGERLSPVQWGLVMAIFAGILLIAVEPGDFKNKKGLVVEAGIFLALAAAFGMGGINFLTALGAKEASPLLAIWFPWFIFTLLCFIVIVFEGKFRAFASHFRKSPGLILGMGIFDTLAWLLFALAVTNEELAVTIAITESYPAVALALGIGFNKERISWHQGVGAAITIAASITIGVLS